MVDIEDRLAPAEGVSDFRVELGAVISDKRTGNAVFRFDIEQDGIPGEKPEKIASLDFYVESKADGLYGLYTRAHDHLIDALRQMLHEADTHRRHFAARRHSAG